MKHIVFTIICIAIGTVSNAKRINPLTEWQGDWKIKSLVSTKNKLVLMKNKVNTIAIDASKSTININLGCNSMNSNISGVGRDNVTFGLVMSTKMGCPDGIGMQEKRLIEILPSINKYKIENTKTGIELTLYQNSKKMLVLVKKGFSTDTKISTSNGKENFPFGKYRLIQQLENGEMKERNLTATTFNIGVESTKEYSANMGCNTINGSIELNNNALAFKPGITTLIGCTGDVKECEDNFIKNLSRINKFMVDANHIMLYENGELIMMLEKK